MAVVSVLYPKPVPNWLTVYGTFIVLAEISQVLISIELGAAIHALLLIVLAAHHVFSRTPKDPQIPVLMLLPLIRLLSLVMPTDGVDAIYWYPLIGAPVIFGAVLVARAIHVTPDSLGLGRPESWSVQATVATTGISLGLILGTFGVDMALRGSPTLLQVLVIGLPFVVMLEELVFRGLLQHVASIRSPNLAIFIPSVLYAAMYLGSGHASVVLGMAGVGLFFGAAVTRTGSLWGVIGAHFILRLILQFDVHL